MESYSSSQNLVAEEKPTRYVCNYVAESSGKRSAMTDLEGELDKKKMKKGKKAKKSRNIKNLTLKITKQPYDPRTEAVALPPKDEAKQADESMQEEVVEEPVASTSGEQEGKDETGGKPGIYQYESIDELLASLDHFPEAYKCPIHREVDLNTLTSQKETVHETFLRCPEKGCPVFCTWNDYSSYAVQCRKQGHVWFTKQRIQDMKCACGWDPTLAIVKKSPKNRNRMYLKCRHGECDLFTWWDRCPFKPVQQLLTPVY